MNIGELFASSELANSILDQDILNEFQQKLTALLLAVKGPIDDAAFRDFLTSEPIKEMTKEYTDKLLGRLSDEDTRRSFDAVDEILEAAGVTGEQFDKMMTK